LSKREYKLGKWWGVGSSGRGVGVSALEQASERKVLDLPQEKSKRRTRAAWMKKRVLRGSNI